MINSCMLVLAAFLNINDVGMPDVTSGWMIFEKNMTYTWVTDDRAKRTNWILIAKNQGGFKKMHKTGVCSDGGKTLNVYQMSK